MLNRKTYTGSIIAARMIERDLKRVAIHELNNMTTNCKAPKGMFKSIVVRESNLSNPLRMRGPKTVEVYMRMVSR